MGHSSVVSSYSISTSFRRLEVSQRTPGFWGVTKKAIKIKLYSITTFNTYFLQKNIILGNYFC